MADSTLLLLLLAAVGLAVAIAIVLLVVLLRRGSQATVELQAERESARRLAEESGQLRGRLASLETGHSALVDERDQLRASLQSLRHEHAQATANLEHARAAQAEMKRYVDEAQTRLSAIFAEQAGKAFQQRGEQFEKEVRAATEQGRNGFEALLKPFAERIGEFRERVDMLYSEEAKERASLAGVVNELKTLNQDMAAKTTALTQALRGNARVRGDWGELMLESVLRSSGLVEGVHYERQQSTTDEDGRRLRPDVVVQLPDERRVVVDSKVNLVAWQDAMNSVDTPELHGIALQRHCEGLRRHVRDLADRNYPKAIGEGALEVTVAFVPIEGALSAALGTDPALQNFAFERGIVFASPNTLMAMLRVIDRLWTRDTMQRRVLQIGEAGGKVLDALTAFLGDFDQVGKRLEEAKARFDSARNRLSESSQAVIPRARRLSELGVKGKRVIAAELEAEVVALAAPGQGADESRHDGDDPA
ncbi:MAG TPA: DNA recombination protein RmuC [Lysobacter sp.]|nr:DNA recombination protein RmuC [Lysobacter sp.]